MNTDQETKLKAFAASSNWAMLLSHSLDKQKWEEFLAAAKLGPGAIAGWMVNMCRRGSQIKRFGLIRRGMGVLCHSFCPVRVMFLCLFVLCGVGTSYAGRTAWWGTSGWVTGSWIPKSSIKTDCDWIQNDVMAADQAECRFWYTVLANESAQSRKGKIEYAGDRRIETIEFVQQGRPIPSLSSTYYDWHGGSVDFEVTTDGADVIWRVNERPMWLDGVNSYQQSGSCREKIQISPNILDKSRSGALAVGKPVSVSGLSPYNRTINVSQEGQLEFAGDINSVESEVKIKYGMDDDNEEELFIDGQCAFSEKGCGVFVWQPHSLGAHELVYRIGNQEWTNTLTVTKLSFTSAPEPNPPMAKNNPKFVSWAPGRRGFCRVTTTSRPASVQKPVFA